MNTKEKIVEQALILFSEKGYSDVYVEDIARAVGIKAPSLYKHYKGKKEIFEAILHTLKDSYQHYTASIGINGTGPEKDAGIYASFSEEDLLNAGQKLFLFFLHDKHMRLFRKLLTLEQFHNPELAALYSAQYFNDPITYQGQLFRLLMDAGTIKQSDPRILALHFYAPIYTLLTLCDRQPEREDEALDLLNAHIRQFNLNYREDKP